MAACQKNKKKGTRSGLAQKRQDQAQIETQASGCPLKTLLEAVGRAAQGNG